LLSFGDDDEIASDDSSPAVKPLSIRNARSPEIPGLTSEGAPIPRRLTPNPHSLIPAPKVQTKATLQAEAVARDNLRREFLALQEAVRNTEILIPFVFYDGTNIPGGVVQVKKGDHVWLFLERCRKVGAQLGVSGGGSGGAGGGSGAKSKNDSRREWARVGVDDLMCVRGEVIIPHVEKSLVHFSGHADTQRSIMSSTTSSPTVLQARQSQMVSSSTIPMLLHCHRLTAQLRCYERRPAMTWKVKTQTHH
jgi:XAP5, circadian clock regulator